MMFLTHSETSTQTIASNLGRSEYSYYFVQRSFRPILERLGRVIEIENPDRDVDALWEAAGSHREDCVFFSFNPPHKTPLGFECPCVPVFAWEFDTVPDEVWDGDARHDWTTVLRTLGRAIVHSDHTRGVISKALEPGFPIASIPAPVWDRYASQRAKEHERRTTLILDGPVIDSRAVCLEGFEPWHPIGQREAAAASMMTPQGDAQVVTLDGVVYTSVFNPFDGRKRAWDMITYFVWALRDRPDATLLLKTSHANMPRVMAFLLTTLLSLRPFRCRILVVHGYVAPEVYDSIVRATTFIVNCSTGEGQCLPLMEFMSCGKPAIAPVHTAMADYVDGTNAFVLDSHPEPTIWPQDPREMFRATRARIDFMSLIRAYQDSFVVARTDPARYERMAANAIDSLRKHCSNDVTLDRLETFLDAALPWQELARDRGRVSAG